MFHKLVRKIVPIQTKKNTNNLQRQFAFSNSFDKNRTNCAEVIVRLSPQLPFQFLEALQGALEVFDDVVSKFVGRREVVEVGKGLILYPEDVKACLVALQDFFDFELAETAFGIFLFVVGFLAFKAVFGIVALNEVPQILVGKWILL